MCICFTSSWCSQKNPFEFDKTLSKLDEHCLKYLMIRKLQKILHLYSLKCAEYWRKNSHQPPFYSKMVKKGHFVASTKLCRCLDWCSLVSWVVKTTKESPGRLGVLPAGWALGAKGFLHCLLQMCKQGESTGGKTLMWEQLFMFHLILISFFVFNCFSPSKYSLRAELKELLYYWQLFSPRGRSLSNSSCQV